MAIGKRISPEVICETATYNDTSTHLMCSYAVPSNVTVIAEAVIMGKDSSNAPIVSKVVAYGERATGSVFVGAVSSILSPLIDVSNAGATASIVASSGNIAVQVKGPTIAKQIEWQAELKIYIN